MNKIGGGFQLLSDDSPLSYNTNSSFSAPALYLCLTNGLLIKNLLSLPGQKYASSLSITYNLTSLMPSGKPCVCFV